MNKADTVDTLAPKGKAARAAKADKPETKPSKGGDDAVIVLKAAMGATENTL